MSAGDHRISVVIPARDEAERIAPCLAALGDQQAVEIVVVDDESTDDTAQVAHSAGARVVEGKPLPDGWAGKTWALQQGIEAATGEWIVTLDADTRPRPGLLGAAVHAAERGGHDLLTVAGRFVCNGAAEQALHSSMLATLAYRFGAPGTTTHPERVLANGQCMVLRRLPFLERGGMSAVSGSLVEDVALARDIARGGGKVGFADGHDLLDVHMYESARATWKGWGRSLALAEVTTPARQAFDLAVLWATLGLPLPRLLSGRGDRLDVALLLARLGIVAAVTPSYTPVRATRWLSPLADPAVLVRLTQTTLRPERTWRGRTY